MSLGYERYINKVIIIIIIIIIISIIISGGSHCCGRSIPGLSPGHANSFL